jgi:hypothetical protein
VLLLYVWELGGKAYGGTPTEPLDEDPFPVTRAWAGGGTPPGGTIPPVVPQFQPHCCQLGHPPQELDSETEDFTVYMN